MDRFSFFSNARSRTGFVGVLLLAALVLSAVLAYQAVDAGRSHEEVAVKTVKEQALFAAWEFSGVARAYLKDKLVGPGLETVARHGGKDPTLPLIHPGTEPDLDFGGWSYGDEAAGAFFRWDLAADEITFAGPDDPALEEWVDAGLREHLGLDLGERWDPVMADPGDGGGPVVYRSLPEGEAEPDLVFGFRLRSESLSIPLGYAFEGAPLLPEALTDGLSNDLLFSVVIAAADGRELWRSGRTYRSEFVGTDTVGTRFAGLTTSVTVNPDLAETLVIGGLPRSRLPLALVLLILTAGLVAGALFQLRREAELSRLRADFVSGVSHELRTPLAQIRMFAETLLLGRVRSQEEHRRSLEIIANESRRLTHQVENILLYSRGERRELRADVVPTAVSSVVKEVAESFEPLATKARCRLDVQVEDGLVAAADGGLLRQALLNLLDNAVKYGPSGETIRLAARREASGRTVITVEDRGPGVPLRDRSRIFEPYFRLADHRESAVAGSGIGLSVVQQVAGALGGTVEVGDAEGGGACFALALRSLSTPSGAPVAPAPREILSGAGG